jgi:omega-amidase
MRAHLVQLDIAWEDKPANYAKVERLLDQAQGGVAPGDIILLPEMFDTGFSLNTEKTADKDGATLAFLQRVADDLGCTVQGGRTIHECHCAKASNIMSIFGPGGAPLAEYRKIHPFSYGREPERFVGGSQIVTYRWQATAAPAAAPPLLPLPSLTVCPAICYDLRFPELFRQGLLQGAELIAIGACWPAARAAHWRALLIARAIENQSFVLGVNRTGDDPTLKYVGGSIAIGPKGDILGELGPEEAVLSVTIDPRQVADWRATFPAWKDARLLPTEPGAQATEAGPSPRQSTARPSRER